MVVAIEEAGMMADADHIDARTLGAGGHRVVDGAGWTAAAHGEGGAELVEAE
jgi:hypothetical protein